MRSLFVKLLLFFYLGASYLGASHIHHPDVCHTDDGCDVCVVVKNFHSADVPQMDMPALFADYSYVQPITTSQCLFQEARKGYFSTAPPLA